MENKITNLKGKRILIVDDNMMNRMVASVILKDFDVNISEAENGDQAVKHLENNLCDLILMDLKMPIIDGFQATEIIRQKMKLSTPIIALTANSIEKEKQYCLEIGMNNYLTKPFDRDAFLNMVCKYID